MKLLDRVACTFFYFTRNDQFASSVILLVSHILGITWNCWLFIFANLARSDRMINCLSQIFRDCGTNHLILSGTRTNFDRSLSVYPRGYLLVSNILFMLFSKVSAYPGVTKLFWNLTSPKFSVPVSVMKETIYPKYEVKCRMTFLYCCLLIKLYN